MIDYPDIEGNRTTSLCPKKSSRCIVSDRIKTVEQWREKSNPVFKIHLKPECRDRWKQSEHQTSLRSDKLKIAEKESLKVIADGRTDASKRQRENYSKLEKRIAELEKEKAELQGAKKFSETFFERVFGEQVRNKSFDEIMRMFERKIEESDGEVVVENADGQKRKIKFRKLLGDERINLG